MSLVVGIKFRNVGKIYYFDPAGNDLKKNEHCLVETENGKVLGTVVFPEKEIDDEEVVSPLKRVLRAASKKDLARLEENRALEKEAYRICQAKIKDRELPMKLVNVEYAFDKSKITFYFTADGRIDFRELVKDLAYVFKTRIDLRQIGVRDEAKKHGGYATCGREYGCSSWLSEFATVSIRMAKEQNLVLNPSKISGTCGRLMCCLMYEYNTYRSLRKTLPKIGSIINTKTGQAKVKRLDILQEKIWVLLENHEEACLSRDDIISVANSDNQPERPRPNHKKGKKR